MTATQAQPHDLLIVDNYDSFTYNLVQIVREAGATPLVVKNDKIDLKRVDGFSKILLSPGPGLPRDAGQTLELIERFRARRILGVCLGHQAIAEMFGARLINLERIYHGKQTPLTICDSDEELFAELPTQFNVVRYHSWSVDPSSLPDELIVTATGPDETIMALRHRELDIRGVQFHPESALTEHGPRIIQNWLCG